MLRLITLLYKGEECTEKTLTKIIQILEKETSLKSVVSASQSNSNIDETQEAGIQALTVLSKTNEEIQRHVNVLLEYFVKTRSYSKYQMLVELIEQTNSFTRKSNLKTAISVIGNLTYNFVSMNIREDCGYNKEMHNCVKEVCKTISN